MKMAFVRVIHKYDLPTHTLTLPPNVLRTLQPSGHLWPLSIVLSEESKAPVRGHSLNSPATSHSGIHSLQVPCLILIVMSFPFPASHVTLHLWDCFYLLVFIRMSSFLLCLLPYCSLYLASSPLLCLANPCFPFKTQCRHHFLQKAFPDHYCPTVTSY